MLHICLTLESSCATTRGGSNESLYPCVDLVGTNQALGQLESQHRRFCSSEAETQAEGQYFWLPSESTPEDRPNLRRGACDAHTKTSHARGLRWGPKGRAYSFLHERHIPIPLL